jgi:hypothetical protein
VRQDIAFHLVETMDQVLALALEPVEATPNAEAPTAA